MKVSCLNTQSKVKFATNNLAKNQQSTEAQFPISENRQVLAGAESGSYIKAGLLLNAPSFGKKAISSLPSATADKILEKLNGKKPLVAVDYDGTFGPFVPDPLKALPHGGSEKFLEMIKNLAKSDIPFFILTSRAIEDFSATGVIGKKAKNINRIGLKGNQANLILPKDIAEKLVEKYSKDTDYIVTQKKLKNGKVRVKIEPALIQGFKEAKDALEKGVKKISPLFRIEDKKIMYTLHWRELNESKTEATASEIEKQIKQGQEEFKRICEEKFAKELEDEKLLLQIDKSNMIFELVDARTRDKNKGSIIEELNKLYSDRLPVFMGDSVGEKKDDEYAIAAAEKLKGAGIAVIARDAKEFGAIDTTKASRGTIETDASMSLQSYQDSIPLLNELAEKSKSKK